MKTIVIDCSGVRSPEEFWARYVAATKPDGEEHFGRNLDAFWDAIEGAGPGWPGNVALAFHNTAALAEFRTAGGGSFLDRLREMAAEATRVDVQLS